MNKLLELYAKSKEIILYIVFGGLTTLVNILVYIIFTDLFNINYLISNAISWAVAVLFAYVTNKKYVFESNKVSIKDITIEFSTFVGFRLLSGVLDMIAMFVFIDIVVMNDFVAKIVTQVIVVILNYIFSKLIIFKNVN